MKYRVVKDFLILGKAYHKEGEEMDLTKEQAAQLGDLVEPIKEKKATKKAEKKAEE